MVQTMRNCLWASMRDLETGDGMDQTELATSVKTSSWGSTNASTDVKFWPNVGTQIRRLNSSQTEGFRRAGKPRHAQWTWCRWRTLISQKHSAAQTKVFICLFEWRHSSLLSCPLAMKQAILSTVVFMGGSKKFSQEKQRVSQIILTLFIWPFKA